jgi:Leucine rich repeat
VDADYSLTERSMMADSSTVERPVDTAQCNDTEQSDLDRPVIDPPALPSGDVIDCKNTLQSFDIRASNDAAIISGITMCTNDSNAQASLIQPTLPTGQVIDCKNTMQSYDTTNRNIPTGANIIPMETKRQIIGNRNAESVPVTRNGNRNATTENIPVVAMEDVQAVVVQDVSAVAILEGQLFTESSPRPDRTILWAIGILTIVTAIVITGVCSSGKCSGKAVDLPPSQVPTSSPSFSPPMTSTNALEVMMESAVTSFVNAISFLDEEIHMNGTSPESRALAWLILNDTLFNRTELLTLNSKVDTEVSFRVRQRYPLLTLWFQQRNEDGAFVKTWTNTLGWLDFDNECEWFGINCTSVNLGGNLGNQNIVTAINFGYNIETDSSNLFFGTIPPDIGLLTELTLLDLSFNGVAGSLPESIGQCSRLQVLDISVGGITGMLPSSIGKLTAMEHFDVSLNALEGTLPPVTEQWLDVTFFDIGGNALSGSLPDVGTWTALRGLGLDSSYLTGTIPQAIGQWTALEYLNLGSNALTGTLPLSISELTSLTYVDFSLNRLNGTFLKPIVNWNLLLLLIFPKIRL